MSNASNDAGMGVGPGMNKTGDSHVPVAIIGFGVAGFNAAVALRGAGYTSPIGVFNAQGGVPYSPILTSYFVAGQKGFDECFPWSREEVDALGLDMHWNCRVDGLDVDTHTVRTPDGDFTFRKCLIATGATPTTAGFPVGCGYDPLVLHSMEDAERMKSLVEMPSCRRVLVSGASMVALKIVEACLAHGIDVTLVGMNPHVLDFNALPAAAERFERGLVAKGVHLRLGQVISAVEVQECNGRHLGRRLVVTFSDGTSEEFDEVAVAHGMRCNLDFLAPGSLQVDRGVLVDDFMRTSHPDVYAAGDMAQAMELTSGKRRIVGIWKNAADQGACAGRAMAAELAGEDPAADVAFPGSIPSNTIAVDGTLFISAGTMDAGPEGEVEVREGEDMTVVYVYRRDGAGSGDAGEAAGAGEASRKLVGFNIASDVDEEGGVAYDTGAMLTLRIMEGLGRR